MTDQGAHLQVLHLSGGAKTPLAHLLLCLLLGLLLLRGTPWWHTGHARPAQAARRVSGLIVSCLTVEIPSLRQRQGRHNRPERRSAAALSAMQRCSLIGGAEDNRCVLCAVYSAISCTGSELGCSTCCSAGPAGRPGCSGSDAAESAALHCRRLHQSRSSQDVRKLHTQSCTCRLQLGRDTACHRGSCCTAQALLASLITSCCVSQSSSRPQTMSARCSLLGALPCLPCSSGMPRELASAHLASGRHCCSGAAGWP